MLKCDGHSERKGEERSFKKEFRVNVDGNRERGKTHMRWRDELKNLMMARG